MTRDFLDELGRRLDLNDRTREILAFAGVTDYPGLYSLVTSFPSTSRLGLNVAALSSAARQHLGRGARSAQRIAAAGPPKRPHGVRAPGNLPPVPMPPTRAMARLPAKPVSARPAVNVRLSSWSVKDQGERGTCVAFATAAVLEHRHDARYRSSHLPCGTILVLGYKASRWRYVRRRRDHAVVCGQRARVPRRMLGLLLAVRSKVQRQAGLA